MKLTDFRIACIARIANDAILAPHLPPSGGRQQRMIGERTGIRAQR
ncbi:hypothetical protein [Streptomyces sp. NPDC053367]